MTNRSNFIIGRTKNFQIILHLGKFDLQFLLFLYFHYQTIQCIRRHSNTFKVQRVTNLKHFLWREIAHVCVLVHELEDSGVGVSVGHQSGQDAQHHAGQQQSTGKHHDAVNRADS
jgi:hypothetical protein